MKSNYSSLWLLLAVALTVVVICSFSDGLTLMGWQMKKAPVAENLFPAPAEEAPLLAEIPDSVPPVDLVVEEPKLDSLPKSILLFGDSMTLNLAFRLAKYATANGHKLHAVNWDSSNTKIWAESDTLRHFIRKYNADYVFISLGSNEVYFKQPDVRLPYVKKILADIGDIPYVWIGPPNWNEDTGINDMLQKACKPGAFFRSQGMKFRRKADHIHPTRSSSASWIDSIMRWMPKSHHPILANAPADTLGKVKTHVEFLEALNK